MATMRTFCLIGSAPLILLLVIDDVWTLEKYKKYLTRFSYPWVWNQLPRLRVVISVSTPSWRLPVGSLWHSEAYWHVADYTTVTTWLPTTEWTSNGKDPGGNQHAGTRFMYHNSVQRNHVTLKGLPLTPGMYKWSAFACYFLTYSSVRWFTL